MLKILHISDLHVHDPKNVNEHLRDAFFEEYLGGLLSQIKSKYDRIDHIAVTGDFVHKGSTTNFSHVSKIIQHFLISLDVPEENIAVCIGNHDFSRTDPASREVFCGFASNLGNQKVFADHQIDVGRHCKLGATGLDVIILDSTVNPLKEGLPGQLAPEDVDKMMGWVKLVDITKPLLILSHFPADVNFQQFSICDEDDPDWGQKHLWHSAATFFNRVMNFRTGGPTIWLSGDIHKSDQAKQGEIYSIACGRLGTGADAAKATQALRQVKIIHIGDGQPFTEVFEYHPLGHSDTPSLIGEWKVYPGKKFDSEPVAISEPEPVPPIYDKIITIDPAAESEIIYEIREKKLYHFGRFLTSKNSVALSWVTMGPLLNERLLYAKIVKLFSGWIKDHLFQSSLNASDIILVGIDCWGAILASHLSIVLSAPNICIATRARGSFSLPTENLSHNVIAKMRNSKAIILISDVVRTGESYKYIFSKVMTATVETENVPSWYGLSIICDKMQKYYENIDFLSKFATIVGDLRMPIVSADILPDESILPNYINFFPK